MLGKGLRAGTFIIRNSHSSCAYKTSFSYRKVHKRSLNCLFCVVAVVAFKNIKKSSNMLTFVAKENGAIIGIPQMSQISNLTQDVFYGKNN